MKWVLLRKLHVFLEKMVFPLVRSVFSDKIAFSQVKRGLSSDKADFSQITLVHLRLALSTSCSKSLEKLL